MTKDDRRAVELFSGKRTTGIVCFPRGGAKDLVERLGDIPVVEVVRLLDADVEGE